MLPSGLSERITQAHSVFTRKGKDRLLRVARATLPEGIQNSESLLDGAHQS